MKKLFTFLSITALLLVFVNSSQAQQFQNTNAACESELIPCASVTSLKCAAGSATSVACKNSHGTAQFTSSGFVDCAVSVPARDPSSVPTPVVTGVLINKASGATSCASGSGSQFGTDLDYGFSSFDTLASSVGFGSVVVGNIDGGSFSDMEVPGATLAGPSTLVPSAVTAKSVAAGGFGADELSITTTSPGPVTWQTIAAHQAAPTSVSDRTNALINCNGKGGPLDLIVPVADPGTLAPGDFRINVLLNGGTGLAAASSSVDTGISTSGGVAPVLMSVAVGDFNNDGIDDVAAVFGTATANRLIVGINNGSCGFTFFPTGGLDLTTAHTGTLPVPRSIVVGDFNGDGNADVAISEPGLAATTRGVHYYFGNGSSTFAFTTNTHVSFTGNPVDGSPSSLTTGCFNNDNVVDVAGTYLGPGTGGSGNVRVINSDGLGGLQTPVSLAFSNTNLIVAGGLTIHGIDAADFDAQGGDDIIALGTDLTDSSRRKAYVFMNTVETIVANAGAAVSTQSSSVQLTGTCATNPADATAVFAPTWTIVSPASGGTLTNATTLTPTLTTTTDAAYTLRLTCRTRCTATATATVVVTKTTTTPTTPADNLCLEGDGLYSKPSTNCGAGCAFNPLATFSWAGILAMFSGLGVLWRIRRKK